MTLTLWKGTGQVLVDHLSSLVCLMFSCDENGITDLRKNTTKEEHPLIVPHPGKHHMDGGMY